MDPRSRHGEDELCGRPQLDLAWLRTGVDSPAPRKPDTPTRPWTCPGPPATFGMTDMQRLAGVRGNRIATPIEEGPDPRDFSDTMAGAASYGHAGHPGGGASYTEAFGINCIWGCGYNQGSITRAVHVYGFSVTGGGGKLRHAGHPRRTHTTATTGTTILMASTTLGS